MFFFSQVKISKLFPRHPYRARSQSKIMEALEESNEQLKNEVHELKGPIAKILKSLLSLEKKASKRTPPAAHVGLSVTPTYPPSVPVHTQPQGAMGQVTVHVNRPMQEDPQRFNGHNMASRLVILHQY